MGNPLTRKTKMPPTVPDIEPGNLAEQALDRAREVAASVPEIGRALFDVVRREFISEHTPEDEAFEQRLGCEVLMTDTTTDVQGERREHRYVRIPIDDSEHHGWFTKAKDDYDTGITLIVKPGLGEIVDDGIGEDLHKHLADMLPGFDIFSHESAGMGHFVQDTSLGDLWEHGIDKMTEEGLELIKRLCPDRKIVLFGTSMGTIINTRLANRNLALPKDERVDIERLIHYDPALVDPSRIADMLLGFLPELITGAFKEFAFQTNPKRWLHAARTLVRSKPSARNAVPMLRQTFDIVHCTSEVDIINPILRYKTDVIAGKRGKVEQNQMWLRLTTLLPNLTYYPVEGRGHAMAMNPFKTARKAAKIMVAEGVHPPVFVPDKQQAA